MRDMAHSPKPQPTTSKRLADKYLTAAVAKISPIQKAAMNLYGLGLNVFPLPYGKKGGYPWQMLQYTRLNAKHLYTLFSGRCNIAVMTGRTSGNLLVIDCETSATFTYYEQLLRDAGIPIWAVKSNGKRKGGHFYLRCRDGEVRNVRPGERRDMEIRGNRCYVLAPPSLHPNTKRLYQWHVRETLTPPAVTIEQVHWLGLTLTRDSPKTVLPQSFSELSHTTRDFLLNGAAVGERNNRLFSAACDLSGNDYDIHAAMQLLIPMAQKCELPDREIRDSISSAYSKPRTPAKVTAKRQRRPPQWQIATTWAQHHQWKGRTGQTDRAVFLACCERAKTANETGVFRAAVREIAELARIRPNTASLSVKRLTAAKFLTFIGRDRGSKAHLYRLGATTTRTPASIKTLHKRYTSACTSGDISVSVARQIFSSDASERRALDKTASVLYSVMLSLIEPMCPRDLARVSLLSKHQVYRALKKLSSYGLVAQVGRAYYAVPMTGGELDEQVARPAGTLGKGEERRAKHRRERADRAASRLYKARFPHGRTITPSQIPGPSTVRYACHGCGQIWEMPGLVPPLACDYCDDTTTWQVIS